MKKFLWKIKSKPEFEKIITIDDFRSLENDESNNGVLLYDFVIESEKGDVWENDVFTITCLN